MLRSPGRIRTAASSLRMKNSPAKLQGTACPASGLNRKPDAYKTPARPIVLPGHWYYCTTPARDCQAEIQKAGGALTVPSRTVKPPPA